MATGETPVLSFVLPAYNEEMNIVPMTKRLCAIGAELGDPFEIIWINDGSTDRTGEILDELAAADSRIKPLHFSRNFGQMAALTAGMEAASATGAVITLDADGEKPPELIPRLVERWRAGADIVQTVHLRAPGEPAFKRITSRWFYKVLGLLGEVDLPEGAADFRLLDREAVDALNALPERVRFVRGLVYWVGFRRDVVPYEPLPRLAGATKYTVPKMMGLAFSGITSFSTRPLRLSFLMAFLVTLIAAAYAAYVLVRSLIGIPLVPGWASLVLIILILGGAQLFAIGIASEYLARVFTEQKRRPVYILRKPKHKHARNAD